METWPDELLLFVFSSLRIRDIGRAARVSQQWRRITSDTSLWRAHRWLHLSDRTVSGASLIVVPTHVPERVAAADERAWVQLWRRGYGAGRGADLEQVRHDPRMRTALRQLISFRYRSSGPVAVDLVSVRQLIWESRQSLVSLDVLTPLLSWARKTTEDWDVMENLLCELPALLQLHLGVLHYVTAYTLITRLGFLLGEHRFIRLPLRVLRLHVQPVSAKQANALATDEYLPYLTTRCPNLDVFEFSGVRMARLRAWEHIARIREFHMPDAVLYCDHMRVTDPARGRLEKLTLLALRFKEAMAHTVLPRCRSLRSVRLCHHPRDDNTRAYLEALPGGLLSASAVAMLASLNPNLEELWFAPLLSAKGHFEVQHVAVPMQLHLRQLTSTSVPLLQAAEEQHRVVAGVFDHRFQPACNPVYSSESNPTSDTAFPPVMTVDAFPDACRWSRLRELILDGIQIEHGALEWYRTTMPSYLAQAMPSLENCLCARITTTSEAGALTDGAVEPRQRTCATVDTFLASLATHANLNRLTLHRLPLLSGEALCSLSPAPSLRYLFVCACPNVKEDDATALSARCKRLVVLTADELLVPVMRSG